MADEELPEWTTPLDEEILELLNTEMTLTPSVIADNIDRSRGAITRRLNSLEAGGLVTKVDRGKYRITGEGLDLFEGGWQTLDISDEKKREMAKEEYERQIWIEEELGMTQSEYLSLVVDELEKLEAENPDEDGLLGEALEIVAQKHRDEPEN